MLRPVYVSDAHIRSESYFSQGFAKGRKIQLQPMIEDH